MPMTKIPIWIRSENVTIGSILLRLAGFCGAPQGRLQKSERCASNSSLFRPLDALRCRCPLSSKE